MRSEEHRAQLLRDPEFRSAREHLIATTPERKRAKLLERLDRVEVGGYYPAKLFGAWNDRHPWDRYALALTEANRRLGARLYADRQLDAKVNVTIGDSSDIGTGHVIRYAERLVNDTLVFRNDVTPEILGAGIAFLQRTCNTEGLVALTDAVIPIDPVETEPISPERRRALDDVITHVRTNGVVIDLPRFGTLRGWTTLVKRVASATEAATQRA